MMSRAILIVTLIFGIVAFAQTKNDNNGAREKQLDTFVEKGIITEHGKEKGLTYGENAYQNFSNILGAIEKKMQGLGYKRMDDVINPKHQEEIKQAARDKIKELFNLQGDKADKEAQQKLDYLMDNCGCLRLNFPMSQPSNKQYNNPDAESSTAT